MKNIEFLAKTIFSSLSDVDVERLHKLMQDETDRRHITHGQCTPVTCTVMEEIQREFHEAIQRIGTDY